MDLGLSTLLFPNGTPEEGVELASRLDVDCVEIILDMPHFPLHPDPERLERLGESIRAKGMTIRTHGRFWDVNPVSVYPRMRQLTLDQTIESIKACSLLGGDIVTIHPGRCWFRENKELFEESKNCFQDYLSEISDFAEERNIAIGVETGSYGADYPGRPEELLQTIRDHQEVGITFDVGHTYLSAKDQDKNSEEWISHLVDRFGKDIVNVHIHDNHGTGDEHLPPGRGNIDFERVIEELEDHYNGPLVLELWDPPDPLKAARESFEYIRSLLQ